MLRQTPNIVCFLSSAPAYVFFWIGIVLLGFVVEAQGQCVRLPDNTWSCSPATQTPATRAPHSAICRIYARRGNQQSIGSGVLVWRGETKGLILTVEHVVREQSRVTVVFPNGDRHTAERIQVDAAPDLAALTIARPDIEPMSISTDAPLAPGHTAKICGYDGPTGRYREAAGRVVGYAAHQGSDGRTNLVVKAPAVEGNSGGPIVDSDGELVAILWGTRSGSSYGTYGARICQFLSSDRFIAPWNAATERTRIKAEAGAYTPPTPSAPAVPPAAGGPVIDATARQMAQEALSRIEALVKEVAEADAAVETATEVSDQAATVAATAATDAKSATEEVTELKGGLRDRIRERIKEGVLPLITAKIQQAGIWGFAGVGAALVGLYFLVKRDVKNRIETGDPLFIEKLAARTRNPVDDRLAAAIADRLQSRFDSRSAGQSTSGE